MYDISMGFSNVQLPAIMNFIFLKKKTPKEIYEWMMETLGVECLLYSTVNK